MAAVFVFMTTFAVYAWTSSPAPGWLDSPEFVAAAVSLGVPHSPGHPLVVLLGALGTLLPVGDLATRVNLISALASALAFALVQVITARLLGEHGIGPADRASADSTAGSATGTTATIQAMSAGIALVVAFSPAAWGQAMRAEVYALELLLFVATCHYALAYLRGQKPGLRAGCLLSGLALATHHFIALTFLFPVLICLPRQRDATPGSTPGTHRLGAVCAALVLGLFGLAVLCYLPVRSAAHPLIDWGAPHTAWRWFWTVSARAFQKAVTVEQVSTPGEDAAEIVAMLADNLTWALVIAGLVGIYLGVRRPATRRATLFLAGVLVLGGAGRVIIGFDPVTPDDRGYLLPALTALAMLGGTGAFTVVSGLAAILAPGARRWPAAVLAALCLVLVPITLVRSRPALAMSDAPTALARWELDTLPPRTVLLVAYFQTSFRLMASQAVEQARPDVAILDRSFLTYPGAADEARLAHPELAALIDAPLAAGAPTPIALLAAIARQRPVAVELHPNLEDAVHPWLVPLGAFARFVATPPGSAERERAEATDIALGEDIARRLADVPPGDAASVSDLLLWHGFNRVRFYCQLGRKDAARATFARVWSLAPGDSMLAGQAEACHLAVPPDARLPASGSTGARRGN